MEEEHVSKQDFERFANSISEMHLHYYKKISDLENENSKMKADIAWLIQHSPLRDVR